MKWRVLPDVQALVQGFISRKGAAGTLLASWERSETDLITCKEILDEFQTVLARPHIRKRFPHVSDNSVETFSAALKGSTVFMIPDEIPRAVSDDPDDDIVLACAVAGNADYIVTRDHHLLELGMHRGIPIVTPEAFAAILRGQVSEELGVYIIRPGMENNDARVREFVREDHLSDREAQRVRRKLASRSR